MQLTADEAARFFKLNRALMYYVNQQLGVIPDIETPDQFSHLSPELRSDVREQFLQSPDLIESFVATNPFAFTEAELAVVSSWRNQVPGRFFVFRYLKNFTVFLRDKPPTAYGVIALTDPIESLVGPRLPCWCETTLLPFEGKIVYDGLLGRYNISLGPGFRRSLNESYKLARKRLGIVTSLPVSAAAKPATTTLKRTKPSAKRAAKAPKEIAVKALDEVLGLIEPFCRDYLNEEYATLCRSLAEKLARKRPSPLLGGRPNTWACGIVRTIGWVNFLDDRGRDPHLKLTAIDKYFGVGESTGQGKSKQIRRLLKFRQFDHRWTLPSRIDAEPMIWMLEVNGLFMDIRKCPREAQQLAFKKGLIPYVHADRE